MAGDRISDIHWMLPNQKSQRVLAFLISVVTRWQSHLARTVS